MLKGTVQLKMQMLFHENVVIMFFYATQHKCLLSFEYNMGYFKNVGTQTVADNH